MHAQATGSVAQPAVLACSRQSSQAPTVLDMQLCISHGLTMHPTPTSLVMQLLTPVLQ